MGDKMKKKFDDMTQREFFKVVRTDTDDCPENYIDCFDQINMYGTYEIQRTADTSNVFPTISQGYSGNWKPQKPKKRKP